MKQLLPIIAVILLVGTIASCSSKKQREDIITTKYEKPAPQGPIRTDDYKDTKQFRWLDRDYTCTIERMADDSLPMVKDETGQQFVDNRVRVVITRADGSKFFDKEFTKVSFDSYINEDYRKTGILEGFVFDRVENSEVRFACSVSRPQSDEFIPLILSVNRMGNIDIKQDTRIDTEMEDAPVAPEEEPAEY
ncbi:MAG: DUF4738 domain-containing protein [Prevotella sp.]|jgi:hypothetical protein|nr:DUF4738 domain-containing protein [Prevotella sp.]